MTDLDDVRRLGELEHVAELVEDLLRREREHPGSVSGTWAIQGVHNAVTFWSRLGRARI